MTVISEGGERLQPPTMIVTTVSVALSATLQLHRARARVCVCIRASAAAAGAHEWPGTHPHENRQQLGPEITENLYLLNQTAKRKQLSEMPTISRCLLGIMQIDTL
jgi:hypothetical protein